MSFTLHGLGVSTGIAIGRARLLSHATLEVAHLTLRPKAVDAEITRFENAVEVVKKEFIEMRESVSNSADLTAFINLHKMFLDDPELIEEAKTIILERHCNAEWALVQRLEHLEEEFDAFEDPYLRERKFDVRQVVERVVKELLGHPARPNFKKIKATSDDSIIAVAHDLSPADVINFKDQPFVAFVTDVGGITSHTAILARSLGIPAIVGIHAARDMIKDDEEIIIDGLRGVIIVNPDAIVLEEYELRRSKIELDRSKLKRLKTAHTMTLDRIDVALHANIEMPYDVETARAEGAEGIGLFRTEFLYLNRGELPSEEEQFDAYHHVVKNMKGKPVTIRVFDLGADKTLLDRDRLPTNPALGRRAIRLMLEEPHIFHTQLRAILRASKYGQVKLLIPMLSHAHEIESSWAAIEKAKESLRNEKIDFDENIAVGGMVEIPAAAISLGPFLRRLNFLSIGTNDLIQYTLAIDRQDEEVAALYDPLHPAVLFLIHNTLQQAEKAGIPVSLCGEMAGDSEMTWLLLGMGLREFSMHSKLILNIKQLILKANVEELTQQVKKLLKLDEPQKIRESLEKLNNPRPTVTEN